MKEKTVHRIREFNRFYMPTLELLGNHYLDSEYSVTEARVLYEVFYNNGCNASYIAKAMNIDKSYLSRIIKKHEKSGYIFRKSSEKDSRAFEIYLTEKGKERARDFIQKSNEQIGEIEKFCAKGMYTGTGAGSACLKACIDYAEEKKVEKIVIVSNRKCTHALNLYRKNGFVEVPVDKEKFPYNRADIAFERVFAY